VENPAAWKGERVRNVPLDDGKFKVASERRGGDGLPHTGTTPNTLVRRHRAKIEHVSLALEAYGKLSADEIDVIVDWHRG
jgi:hypothetical protein